jgi:hypothetical protein
MMERKVTLLTTDRTTSSRRWNLTTASRSRMIVVPNFRMLRAALDLGMNEAGQDIERVIIDGTIDSTAFLEMLATLPTGFRGDILYINGDGRAFLSATGRSDDRVLYTFQDADLQFYLEINHLQPTLQLVPPPRAMAVEYSEAVM